MATKEDKVRDINQAIHRSSVAMTLKAKAEILKDGRVQYSEEATAKSGRKYRARSTFREILRLLHGEDMRDLHKKYGR